MTTQVTLPFAGGTFRFHLDARQMFMLETGTCGHGSMRRVDMLGAAARPIAMGEAYARLLRGRYDLNDRNVGLLTEAAFSVVEMDAIIRAALVGGGGGIIGDRTISWTDECVDTYLREHLHPLPLAERWDLCLAIMGARVEGLSTSEVVTDGGDQ